MGAGMPLAIVKTAEPQLTGVRGELAHRAAELKAAMAALELARQPEQRLGDAIREYEAAAAELAARKAEHMSALSGWLADPQGSTPLPSVELAEAQHKTTVLRELRDAAEARLPSATAAVAEASARVGAAYRQLEQTAMRAVVEAAADFAGGPLIAAHNFALNADAVLEGLEQLLAERGRRDGDGSPAHRAGLAVAQLRREAKAAAGVAHNLERGRKLLNSIIDDPGAVLEIG
jgi:hypothetical protein